MDPRTARKQASRRLGSVRLDPRRRVSIRPIDELDRPGLSAFYAALSTESIRRRFLGCHRVADAELDAMVRDDGIVAVLNAPGPEDGAIVAHTQICPDGRDSAEVAFAVRDDLQGKGIGRSMVAAAIGLTRRRGWRRLTAVTSTDNLAMRHLLIGAGCDVESDHVEAGVEEIVLRLAKEESALAAPVSSPAGAARTVESASTFSDEVLMDAPAP